MIAKDLIAQDVPSLTIQQTGRDAFHLLSEHHVKHLPVVDAEQRLVGILSEEDVFNHKLYEPLGEYDFSMIRRFAVQLNEHLFDVLRLMGEHRLTVMPVIDPDGIYQGLITQAKILRAFAEASAFAEAGGILILEMQRRDYALSTIARIIEEENVKILGSFVTSNYDSDMLEVTIKINRTELSRVIAALQRFEYNVIEAFPESLYSDGVRERFDSFMQYLNG